MEQNLLIGLIVVAAAAYTAWAWMPAAWRARLGGVHPALARPLVCGARDSGCGTCAKAPAPAPSPQPTRRTISIAADCGLDR